MSGIQIQHPQRGISNPRRIPDYIPDKILVHVLSGMAEKF